MLFLYDCFFFLKQKTAYDMRISDWSSDVCSSDLPMHPEIVRDEPGSCPICGMALEPTTVSVEPGPNPEYVDFRRRFVIGAIFTVPLFEIGRASCRERVCQYV